MATTPITGIDESSPDLSPDDVLSLIASRLSDRPVALTCATLGTWLANGACPSEALEEAGRRWRTLAKRKAAVRLELITEDGEAVGTIISNRGRRIGTLNQALPAMLEQWNKLGPKSEQQFPLSPLVRAWLQNKGQTYAISRRPQLIIPTQAARHQAIIPGIAPSQTPETPGFVPAPVMEEYLPGLEPEPTPIPGLLALYDKFTAPADGRHVASQDNIHFRIFLMALVTTPLEARNGQLQETDITIRAMIDEWLGWSPKTYRPQKATSGGALRRAMARVRDMYIPIPRRDRKPGPSGWQFPIMISELDGFELNDHVKLVMRIPQGNAVGPSVDRQILKKLGMTSGPAYRMYLNLCCDWDYYGGRNGKLIRPTRPEVLRADGGQVVDSEGRIVTSNTRQPIFSPHDPRAIRTGRRELNPARERYPFKEEQDLLLMAYGPAFVSSHVSRRNRARYVARALKGLSHIEELGGCTVEQMENTFSANGLPVRIMPHDRDAPALPAGKVPERSHSPNQPSR